MAITTLDGAIAGMQPTRSFVKSVGGTMVAGKPHSFWTIAGTPGAGASTAGINGGSLTNATAGAFQFTNPVSGNSYLARFQGCATIAGQLLLIDRLWQNTLTNSTTTAQSISMTLPARDDNASSNGAGVQIAFENFATLTTTPVLSTLSYTDQDGNSSTTTTAIDAFSTTTGGFTRIALGAGDTGVRTITSVTLSTSQTAGTMGLVAYRVICALELPAALIPNAVDALTSGMPRIMDSSCLSLVFIPNTTTTSTIMGSVVWTQG